MLQSIVHPPPFVFSIRSANRIVVAEMLARRISNPCVDQTVGVIVLSVTYIRKPAVLNANFVSSTKVFVNQVRVNYSDNEMQDQRFCYQNYFKRIMYPLKMGVVYG